MSLDPNRTTFTFNHADQVDEYGQAAGDYTVVQETFDSRAEENLEDINNIKTTLKSVTPADSGADAVGTSPILGASGATVRAVLQSLADAISGAILGQIPDNSLTNIKLVPDIKIGSLAALTTTIKTSVVNAINELVTSIALKANFASNATAITFEEQAIVSSGGAATNDWGNGNKAEITLTEDTTLTFTNPSNAMNAQLVIIQDGTGGWVITYPTMKWVNGGTEVQPSSLPAAEDILSMYFNGTIYRAAMNQDFS